MTNHYLGPVILDRLAAGLEPAEAVNGALAGDAGRGIRQVHCVDRQGRTAADTGSNCVQWNGHRSCAGFSVAGNMLAGERVLAATVDAFAKGAEPLAERLLGALHAGQAEGGDRRGIRSAALMVATNDIIPDIDLRVDDNDEPLTELSRLLGKWREELEPFGHWKPNLYNPSGFTDLDAIEEAWRANGSDLRFTRAKASSRD